MFQKLSVLQGAVAHQVWSLMKFSSLCLFTTYSSQWLSKSLKGVSVRPCKLNFLESWNKVLPRLELFFRVDLLVFQNTKPGEEDNLKKRQIKKFSVIGHTFSSPVPCGWGSPVTRNPLFSTTRPTGVIWTEMGVGGRRWTFSKLSTQVRRLKENRTADKRKSGH